MPIYEYRCEQGHTFEVMRRMSDDRLTTCQVCSAPVQQVFHPIAVHFKGSGFYNTDYGTKKRSQELRDAGEGKGKYEKADSSGSEGSSSSSSESGSSSSGGDKSNGAGKGKSESSSSSGGGEGAPSKKEAPAKKGE